MPVNSNKVKTLLKQEGGFDIFIKFDDQIEQVFKTVVKFMINSKTLMEIIVDSRRCKVTKSRCEI